MIGTGPRTGLGPGTGPGPETFSISQDQRSRINMFSSVQLVSDRPLQQCWLILVCNYRDMHCRIALFMNISVEKPNFLCNNLHNWFFVAFSNSSFSDSICRCCSDRFPVPNMGFVETLSENISTRYILHVKTNHMYGMDSPEWLRVTASSGKSEIRF